jgi:hypothetical protein
LTSSFDIELKSIPSKIIRPAVGASSRAINVANVVFPLPVSPTMVIVSFELIENVTSSTA